jgi:hypothetical protein
MIDEWVKGRVTEMKGFFLFRDDNVIVKSDDLNEMGTGTG